jgi:hypothetical protein
MKIKISHGKSVDSAQRDAQSNGSSLHTESLFERRPSLTSSNPQDARNFFAGIGIEYLHQSRANAEMIEIMSRLLEGMHESVAERYRWSSPGKIERLRAGYLAPLEIHYINSRVGYGCFAAEDIKGGDPIGEYTGEYINEFRQSAYQFSLHDEPVSPETSSLCIDALYCGNHTRFINSCEEELCLAGAGERSGYNVGIWRNFLDGCFRVEMYARRDIAKGEELRTNYGPNYFYYHNIPQDLSLFRFDGHGVVEVETKYVEDGLKKYGLDWLI